MALHHHSKAIQTKIRKIMHEGIRGRKVSQKQAVAVAFSIMRKKQSHKRKKY